MCFTQYPSELEREYCAHPGACPSPDVLVIGSALGTATTQYLCTAALRTSQSLPMIVVAEAGPFDLPDHLGNVPGFSRRPFIESPARVGGKLMVWGMSTPRPRPDLLSLYPYNQSDLLRRFTAVEQELGVPDAIPDSGKDLELQLLSALRHAFPDARVGVAPLAIDCLGRRWSPARYIPSLTDRGVSFLTRFRVDSSRHVGDRFEISGEWFDGTRWTIRPRFLVAAMGCEATFSFVRPLLKSPSPPRYSDHHRIDLHGYLPEGSFGRTDIDGLGVAVLIIETVDNGDGIDTPYHLEVKVAPCGLWRRGRMQSSDNLCGRHSDGTIYIQIQAVSAMKKRLPIGDILNVGNQIPRVMSASDAAFHGRIISEMRRASAAIGLTEPTFAFRELTTNHHIYRAFEVGETITNEFRSVEDSSVYILPPAAFFSHECCANPTLKSLVLSQYAADDLLAQLNNDRVPRSILQSVVHRDSQLRGVWTS